MEKLNEHLFDLEPLKLDFRIDPSAKRFTAKTFKLRVTSYSETPTKLLQFLARYNYSYFNDDKVTLADSESSAFLRKREQKHNAKIVASIDKIKAAAK